MKSQHHNINDSVLMELFADIPPEVVDTFNEEQLKAIKKVLMSRSWSRHCINLRFSIPLPRSGFYLMLLAGPERRSKERRYADKVAYPLLNFSNIAFLIGFLIILSTSTFITLPFVFSSLISSLNSISTSSAHPTSIPWLEDKFNCEHTGRTWSKGQCWDSEHNPMF